MTMMILYLGTLLNSAIWIMTEFDKLEININMCNQSEIETTQE